MANNDPKLTGQLDKLFKVFGGKPKEYREEGEIYESN